MIIGIFILCDLVMLADTIFAIQVAKLDYKNAAERAIRFRPRKWVVNQENIIPIIREELEQ